MILSAAMMLDHLGEGDAGRAVRVGVRTVLAEGEVRTHDLGGSSGTVEMTEAVATATKAARNNS
jgi:isocitrate/isopropylmalate dehydrogenase